MKELLCELPKITAEAAAEANAYTSTSVPPVSAEREDENEDESEDEIEDESETTPAAVFMLHPRTIKTFYKGILKDTPCWKRPPENHCDRCAEFAFTHGRIMELTAAMISTPNSPERENLDALVRRAGGTLKAGQELRELTVTNCYPFTRISFFMNILTLLTLTPLPRGSCMI